MSAAAPSSGTFNMRAMATQLHLARMDHRNYKLKNPPKVYTGPDPEHTLPVLDYPEILQHILSVADPETLLSLRTTCTDVNKLVDREYARHIEVSSPHTELEIKSRYLGRIPSLRFKGDIAVGVSLIPESGTMSDADAQYLIHTARPGQLPVSNMWLRVHPSSVEWFTQFMRHVRVVDMDGGSALPILLMPRSEQEKCDPYSRVFLDRFTVPLIRMYPSEWGVYASYVPFTSPFVVHSVQLIYPQQPATETWLHNAPRISEGTRGLYIAVHLHPNLSSGLSISDPLEYPASLKTVSVDLKPLAVIGQVHPTRASFKAISNLWPKIFAGFRPGLTFLIHNIHLWDDIDFPVPPRDVVLFIFCLLWKGAEALRLDYGELWNTCWPHVKFLRGPAVMSPTGGPLVLVHANHDGTPQLNPDGSLATFAV